MIVIEELTIKDRPFIKTYSDKHVYIKRDNSSDVFVEYREEEPLYSEAIDPAEFHREYVETDIPIEEEQPDE